MNTGLENYSAAFLPHESNKLSAPFTTITLILQSSRISFLIRNIFEPDFICCLNWVKKWSTRDMERLIDAQRELHGRIARTMENLRKVGTAKLSVALIRSTLTVLEREVRKAVRPFDGEIWWAAQEARISLRRFRQRGQGLPYPAARDAPETGADANWVCNSRPT